MKKPHGKTKALIIVLLISTIISGCIYTVQTGDRDDGIIPLTDREIEKYNETFETIIIDDQGNRTVNPLSYFFTSHYDRPEDIDINSFLRYFPSDGDVGEGAEFDALKKETNWHFGKDITPERMPVPIHKFHRETINEILEKYMDITLDDLSSPSFGDLIYLDEYDAYYNFTSDFAAGTFYCTHGEREGDVVRLYNEYVTLTIKEQGDDFLFLSHRPLEKVIEGYENIKDFAIPVSIKPRGYIPEPVLDYALEYVNEKISDFKYIDRGKITGLKRMNGGSIDNNLDVQIWLLEYRLLPQKWADTDLPEGISMEDMEGESWITEGDSNGQPHLLLAHIIDEDRWDRVCVTNTQVITEEYGSAEMLERYGDQYTAAALELYQRKIKGQDIDK